MADDPTGLAFVETQTLLDELKRRFPAIVWAMQRDALDTEGGQDADMGWHGSRAMQLGLADALQLAVRLSYERGMIRALDGDDEEE